MYVLPRSVLDSPEVSSAFDKISADEFARRHGWRKSAVVQRIKAGIYDSVKEHGTWYVLRDAPREAERFEPEFNHEAPSLPWPTIPFPLGWAGPAFWIGFAIMILPLVVGQVDELFWLFGVGIIVATATQLYEGLVTGTIRAQYTGPMTYSRRPIGFTVHALCYLGYTLIGLFILVDSVFT